MRQLRYSPYPPESYTVRLNGVMIGYGIYPMFHQRPDIWNLFWLSCEGLEDLLDWPPDQVEQVPCYSTLIPACEVSADCTLAGSPAGTLGEQALTLTPTELVSRILEYPDNLPLYQRFGDHWLQVIQERAELYVQPAAGNVVSVSFGNPTRLLDVTKAINSATIMRLSSGETSDA